MAFDSIPVAIGALRLAPRGTLTSRFDLMDDEVGYFADAGESPIYESLARREAMTLSMATVAARAVPWLTEQQSCPRR